MLFSAHGRPLGKPTGRLRASSLAVLGLLPQPQPRWRQAAAEILGADLQSEVQIPSLRTSPSERQGR